MPQEERVRLYENYLHDEDAFPYRQPVVIVGDKKQLSYSLHDTFVRFHTQRRCVDEIGEALETIGGIHLLDERTTTKHLGIDTGITDTLYDCCIGGCMSYAMYPELEECRFPKCQEPRYRWVPLRGKSEEGEDPNRPGFRRIPRATHAVIDLIHRLRLLWSDETMASMMVQYRRQQMNGNRQDLEHTDIWTGDFIAQLMEEEIAAGKAIPIFSLSTDIGLMMSTDGVKVFKSRRSFVIWPMILINLSIPPEKRYKRR